MDYIVPLEGDLEYEVRELAKVHTDSDVPAFLRLLALQAVSPETYLAQFPNAPLFCDDEEEE